jgi:hypothetical protein
VVVKKEMAAAGWCPVQPFLFSNFYFSGLGKTNTPFGGSFI